MATDLTIYLHDQPGELARLGKVLGQAGVNIEGCCAVTTGGGQGEIHVLIEDTGAAFAALESAGIEVADEQEVAVVPVEDRPGVLGEITSKLGDAGVNISLTYLATGPRLVFAADNLQRAQDILK